MLLRDPVRRAISAYKYWMRHATDVSPFLGLKETAVRYPKMRILEYGFCARYRELWRAYVHPERMRVLVFEQDVAGEPSKTVREVYAFLGLDPDISGLGRRVTSCTGAGRGLGYCSGISRVAFPRVWPSPGLELGWADTTSSVSLPLGPPTSSFCGRNTFRKSLRWSAS